jgi:ribosome-interacting GTPase 1
LKSRMAKLKEEVQTRPTLGKAEQSYTIKREGAGQATLLGLPNSGKSTFFSQVTHALSEIGEYPFTTQKPVPGMMPFENIQIQLVDTPPVQPDHVEPGLSNLVRNTDALVFILDLGGDAVFQIQVLFEELNRMRIQAWDRGPISSLEAGWVSIKALVLGNKCDVKSAMDQYRELEARFKDRFPVLPISAKEGMNLEAVRKEVYLLLGIIRVYTKAPGKEPDLGEPVIMRKGSTVEDVALSVHKDFSNKLRYARIWGSGKFEGQMAKRDYRVNEGDVIELHI